MVRALAWLMIVPPFGNRSVMPTVVTIGLAMSLALVVAPHVAGANVPLTLPALIGAVAVQVLTGGCLWLLVQPWLCSVPLSTALPEFLIRIFLTPAYSTP